MILNLHEMFILDWIHKCRQSSLGGFPVWSIVLGFVSHVLLVPFVLLPTFTLRIPLIVHHSKSTQVVNSSANLFIYCAIGARYLTVQRVALIQNIPCDRFVIATRFRAQCWKHFFCRGDGAACQCTQTSAEVLEVYYYLK